MNTREVEAKVKGWTRGTFLICLKKGSLISCSAAFLLQKCSCALLAQPLFLYTQWLGKSQKNESECQRKKCSRHYKMGQDDFIFIF
jgi:hypothetical protein